MIRRFTKAVYASAYTWAQSGLRTSDQRQMPFIVGYHRVVDNFDRAASHSIPALLTSVAMFERHIDWMAKNYRILSLDEIGAQLESRRPFPKPSAAVTFDDGYSDIYRNAFPILKRKGIPAAVFVVTELVGTRRMQVYDKLFLLVSRIQRAKRSVKDTLTRIMSSLGLRCDELALLRPHQDTAFHIATLLLTRMPQERIEKIIEALQEQICVDQAVVDDMTPLTWEMIADMQQNGLTIGSHTMTHALLPQESLQRARTELIESKRILEQHLSREIKHFAYPDGRFNSSVVEVVSNAGYRYGYGICRTRDSRYPLLTIPRKVLWERACLNAFGSFSPAVMECQANWVFDNLRRCSHDHEVSVSCQEQLITA